MAECPGLQWERKCECGRELELSGGGRVLSEKLRLRQEQELEMYLFYIKFSNRSHLTLYFSCELCGRVSESSDDRVDRETTIPRASNVNFDPLWTFLQSQA
jgi:hypothetical protein